MMRKDIKVKVNKNPNPIPIRGLDADLFKEVKIECLRKNVAIGQAFNEAMILWLEHKKVTKR